MPTNKNYWNKLAIPPELAEILRAIAVRQGYSADKLHVFIYQLLKDKYPDATKQQVEFWNAQFLDDDPPE